MNLSVLICTLAFLFASSPASADDRQVLFREDFSTLDNWKPFFFPKIKSHSTYTIELDGDRPVLRAESHASASAIVYKESFNVYEYRTLRWRWKVGNVYRKGDATSKAGDDFPLGIDVMFEYDPEKAGIGESITHGLARTAYGGGVGAASVAVGQRLGHGVGVDVLMLRAGQADPVGAGDQEGSLARRHQPFHAPPRARGWLTDSFVAWNRDQRKSALVRHRLIALDVASPTTARHFA